MNICFDLEPDPVFTEEESSSWNPSSCSSTTIILSRPSDAVSTFHPHFISSELLLEGPPSIRRGASGAAGIWCLQVPGYMMRSVSRACDAFRVLGVWCVQGPGCEMHSGPGYVMHSESRICDAFRVQGVWCVQGPWCVCGCGQLCPSGDGCVLLTCSDGDMLDVLHSQLVPPASCFLLKGNNKDA